MNGFNIILCPYRDTKNYRIDDVILITSAYNKYYNTLFIRVKDVNKNGKF